MDVTTQLDAGTSRATAYQNLDETLVANETYTFTVPTGTVGGAAAIAIPWEDTAAPPSGTLTIPANYTAGTILDSTNGAPAGMEFSFTAGTLSNTDELIVEVAAGDADDLTSAYTWADISTAQLSNDGYFELNADFLGGTNTDMDVEIDFGSSYNTTSTSWENDSLSTTQYSSASTTTFQSATGYGAGDLQSVSVATDGAITGQYSNGQVIPLYRVALAKFQNNQSLFKVGGNLFRETRLSGDPITGKPGTGGLGGISPNSLEQSNVDIATEFVKMITTQRGFQANSKIITVTDQMLAELINLKR
jgi:flagellar hook protein FlgE